jgi:hypothetical protein
MMCRYCISLFLAASVPIPLEALRGLAVEKTVPWLREQGGYCDCEVLANVEDRFGELI